ncbi:2'-5' RNA ligase family protein [Spirilliplanes yamanashiensis]|nr:2'-5' RNA ligase family protein [Spirilliplanes yamanashiensis]MDP9814967.1 hypothetical protein [Spirilliplanes yamanashiensis]
MAFGAGQSAIIVPVPEAEPAVGAWRTRHDSAAAAGVPAHVTLVYPFLPLADVDVAAVRAVLDAHPAFEVTFAATARFPGVLYLAPTPATPFVALVEALVARWPEAPPYGGAFPEIVPHLTVTERAPEPVMAAAEAELTAALPISARVTAAALIGYDGAHWTHRAWLPLRADQPGPA